MIEQKAWVLQQNTWGSGQSTDLGSLASTCSLETFSRTLQRTRNTWHVKYAGKARRGSCSRSLFCMFC